ncbi:MAG TPA: sugar phosphate isomerase/epimerase [Blastocatellia bacterium]|nr:sugar phosphate isomerase/epimerase [Blastocatellia bacterium]
MKENQPDNPSRRQFGRNLFGVFAGAALTSRFAKADPSVVKGVKIGVQSYVYRMYSIDKMIEAIQSTGLTYIELWDGHLNPMKASEADFKAVKNKFDNAGITIGAYCVNFPTNASDEYLDRGFNGALLLGTRVMTASVEKPIVPKLDKWCQKYKIKLGLHNHWFEGEKWFKGDRTIQFENAGDFLNALNGASKYLSINLDVGHFYAAGNDPVSFFKAHHDRIVSLHLKDQDKDPEHTHRRFGKGATPIAEVMKLAEKVKFPFVANIEYELEAANPTDAVRSAYDYLKQVM